MYATPAGQPASRGKVLQVENPYYDPSQQMPSNTVQLRPGKLQKRGDPKPKGGVKQPFGLANMPRPKSDGMLEQMLKPSGLEQMNNFQQYQKLISMRSQVSQKHREDQAMDEYQRLTQHISQGRRGVVLGEGHRGRVYSDAVWAAMTPEQRAALAQTPEERAASAQVMGMVARQRKGIELHAAHLQSRPFARAPRGGGYQTSGAAMVGARTSDLGAPGGFTNMQYGGMGRRAFQAEGGVQADPPGRQRTRGGRLIPR